MLVLSRHRDESVIIDLSRLTPEQFADLKRKHNGKIQITTTIVDIRGDKVRLGIDAPPEIPVHRREVMDAIDRERARAAAEAAARI